MFEMYDSDNLYAVIPDYSKMKWAVRAPTWAELEVVRDKVIACLEAAAHATSCKVNIDVGIGYKDCRQNPILGKCLQEVQMQAVCSPNTCEGDEYIRIAESRYGMTGIVSSEVLQASTDAVSHGLPTFDSCH